MAGIRKQRKRVLDAVASLFCLGYTVLAKERKRFEHAYPKMEYVNKLREKANEGALNVLVVPGSALERKGRFITMGENITLRQRGMEIANFIKEPAILFEGDSAKLNKEMMMVLGHEYSHTLANMSINELPEEIRKRLSIADIEGANALLTMDMLEKVSEILNAKEGSKYWELKQEFLKRFGDVVDYIPRITRSDIIKFDKTQKYPGLWFKRRVETIMPDFFKWERGINPKLSRKGVEEIKRALILQEKVAKEGEDVVNYVREQTLKELVRGNITDLDSYFTIRARSIEEILSKGRPPDMKELREPEKFRVKAISRFKKGDLEHLTAINELEMWRKKLERGQRLPSDILLSLENFARKEKFHRYINELKDAHRERALVDFAIAHRVGRMFGNRDKVERSLGILGAKLRELHETGYRPEEYWERITSRERYLPEPAREKLREMFERGRRKEEGAWGILERMLPKKRRMSARERIIRGKFLKR